MATQRMKWEEFQRIGMLWWINRILHTFGLAIILEVEQDGNVTAAYPARISARGFSEQAEEEGFQNVAAFVEEVAPRLVEEVAPGGAEWKRPRRG